MVYFFFLYGPIRVFFSFFLYLPLICIPLKRCWCMERMLLKIKHLNHHSRCHLKRRHIWGQPSHKTYEQFETYHWYLQWFYRGTPMYNWHKHGLSLSKLFKSICIFGILVPNKKERLFKISPVYEHEWPKALWNPSGFALRSRQVK